MLVVNRGSAPVIITDYNGKRYAFHRGIPVEISVEIYNAIIQSGHVTATEVAPIEAASDNPIPEVEEQAEETRPKRGRRGRK